MARVKRLTPRILKRIISEEKAKIDNQRTSTSRRARKSSASKTSKRRSVLSDVEKARRLRIAESRLRKSLSKVSSQRRRLRKKIYQEL
jgi:hypothetical protein